MKRKPTKNRIPTEHMLTLHQRLYQALNLGIKRRDNEGRKWHCTDIEIQRLTVRSISAFVGCISSDMLQHPLVKDSVTDMVVALIGIMQSSNEAVLGIAAEVTVKLIGVLGNSIPFPQLSKLIGCFSGLLSFHQSTIAASCANALNHIFSKLAPRTIKNKNEIWEILQESKAVDCITCNLQKFIAGGKSYEYFQAMASLLKTVLWSWPPSRYAVWSNVKLVEGLGALCIKPDSSVQVLVLQLFSAIALCGSGANKLLQNGETFLSMILHCMDSSQPPSLRVEAFKITKKLVRSERGWLKIARTCCEPIVKAITEAMAGCSSCSAKIASDQVSLLAEACELALVTRWAGKHHTYLWKLRVDRVLLNLLVDNFQRSKQSQISLSSKELIAAARKGLDVNCLGVSRPYIWAILGWLATHCPEDFSPDTHGNDCLDALITCGCLVLMDTVQKGRQRILDAFSTTKVGPASRTVLLMVHSPCKYIASRARVALSELSTPSVEVYLEYILGAINSNKNGEIFNVVNKDQTVIDLIILSCLSALPKYRSFIIRSDGVRILSMFTKWCLSYNADVIPRSQSTSKSSSCCIVDTEYWEGGDNLLFFSLWGLVELIQDPRFVKKSSELISSQSVGDVDFGGADVQILVNKLQKVSGCVSSSPGLRWCAALVHSFFGFYGFPSRFGKRIGKALNVKDLADVHLKFSSGECLRVHGVMLMVKCPSMLPSRESLANGRISDGSSVGQDIEEWCRNLPKEVRLSARVDQEALMKLLEFVYAGVVQVDDDLVKQLKILARGCDVQTLSQLLVRKRPKWGTKVPCCDFTPALEPRGHHFSDVILEAKADETLEWTCTYCSLSMRHIHVHKIILWVSCDYLKALFQSGMQESHSQSIKVPVSWEALSKLVSWFYSDEIPKPCSGCIWDNMDVEHQLQEVHPYVELCWLSEFWLLEDFREDALRVVVSCVKSSRNLPLKIIKIAFELSQWEIVEVAANCLAPLYPHLRDSGDLAFLDEALVDMVRVAYVRLSQAGDCDYSD